MDSFDTYTPFVLICLNYLPCRYTHSSTRTTPYSPILPGTSIVVGIVQREYACIASSSAQRHASFDVLGIGTGLGAVPPWPFSDRANRED